MSLIIGHTVLQIATRHPRSHWNGLVFVSFLVVLLYFMHNLIISNVYEMYSTSMTDRVVRPPHPHPHPHYHPGPLP